MKYKLKYIGLLVLVCVISLIIFTIMMIQNNGESFISEKFEKFTIENPLIIITPIRDRDDHLNQLLNSYKKVLDFQKVPYKVYAIEQEPGKIFNKGILLNIGFKEAINDYPTANIFIMNDVDNFPLTNDIINFNMLNKGVFHLFGLPLYLNGIFSIDKNTYIKSNGFYNNYWCWGLEDDDFKHRIDSLGIKINRTHFKTRNLTTKIHDESTRSISVAKTTNSKEFIKHYPIMKKMWKLYMNDIENLKKDGLNNANYTIVNRRNLDGYTRILVSI